MKPARTLPILLSTAVLLLGLAAQGALAQSGQTTRVAGTVRDDANAIPIPGASVEVAGTGQVAYTDVDGRYVVDLPPGDHEITIAVEGFQAKTIRVAAGGPKNLIVDVALSMAGYAEQVTVTAEAIDVATSTAEAQLNIRKNAQVISDNMGAQEMKANADGDAAGAMQRITGVSVVNNSYVFVRGLGERYSNTTLNGSVIPTTEPDKKVVPLDLFPSGLLSSVSVVKSYTPDRSADFAGGLVEVVPLQFPNQPVFDASFSFGFNSLTMGKDVNSYDGSPSDWRGFDDGTRALPSAVPADEKVIRGGIYTPNVGVLRSDLEAIGKLFDDNWALTNKGTKPDLSGSLTFGRRFGKLGLLLSYTQSYEERHNQEQQTFYRTSETGLSPFSDYDFDYATQTAKLGAIGNFAYQLSPNHRMSWENFYVRTGKDEARTFAGYNSDIATDIRNQRFFWIEEGLVTTGIKGEHFFTQMGNSHFDWRATFAGADRDEPDLREVLYERNGDKYVLSNQSQSGFRMFNTLHDDTNDGSVNWSIARSIKNRPAQFKFGAQYINRTRDFNSRQFRFVAINTTGLDLSAPPGVLFAKDNIGPHFEIKEQTRTTDTYTADQTTIAGYAMADLVLGARMPGIGGVRIEDFDQMVDTYDAFDYEGDPEIIRAHIKKTDVFPTVNFVYSPRPDQNLRIGFSQTVNRPEFRELAPFEFTDIVGGRAVVGNPDLQRALIQNYDVRYEAFPDAEEVLAASFFYKNFNSPIERIVEPTAQLRTSFTNAENARNFGFELEARKKIGRYAVVGANYTWVDSKITLSPAGTHVQTSLVRPLAGQSENLLNVTGEVRNDMASVRVLYSFIGARISDVGSFGLPDIIEDGRGQLDLVFSYRLFERLDVRVSAQNLTDEIYQLNQGGELQQSFKLGRTYSFNFGFSAF